MRYHELDGVPLSDWPAEARDYAVEDAAATLRVYHAQTADADAVRVLADEYRQTRKAFALRLVEAWGLRTDRAAVDAAAAEATATVDASDAELLAAGIVRPNGTQDMTALRAVVAADYAARGRRPPVTPTGAVKTDADTLRECVAAPCVALVASQHARDFLSDWLPLLRRGETMPVHARFESLLENGRTSTRPNVQNLPRKGGVRPCFVPRSGHVFCSVDYNQLELCALAQVCLWIVGHSSMADAIRRGDDLHSRLGARIQGVSYETFLGAKKAKDPATLAFRQVAKPVNFGFGGGMGASSMVDAVWKQTRVRITEREAEAYRQAWLSEWPEMVSYFRHISGITKQARTATLTQFLSGRLRGACSFTQAANGYFSALANDGAGDALCAVSREMYADPSSPLYGSRIVSFPHDEIVAEVPLDRAHEAGERLSKVMNEVMQRWIPDVPISSEPALMSRLHKGADTVRDGSGRLVVWEPTA
jgi:DNA polymerase-1